MLVKKSENLWKATLSPQFILIVCFGELFVLVEYLFCGTTPFSVSLHFQLEEGFLKQNKSVIFNFLICLSGTN